MAVAGAVHPAALRAAGWSLRGVLSGDPYADRLDVPLLDVDEVLGDERLDAVAVDGEDGALVELLPQLRAAGLLLLLPTPAPLDPAPVLAARAVHEPADAAVGLRCRWQPWALTVAAAVQLVDGPPLQVTVRGWPRGSAAAAELVDLVASWCGEAVAAVAAPGPLPADTLPADALPDGAPVDWALLTASGATVLVSHSGGAQQVRLSFATARLEAGPAGARWVGGAGLPLLPLPAWVPAAQGADPGLVATAAALAAAVGHGGEIAADSWPWPADLGDLLVVSRVLEALRTSSRTGALVPVA